MELIDKAEVLAAIKNAAKSNPLYVTIAEKDAFKDGVNDALESVLKLEVKAKNEEYKENLNFIDSMEGEPTSVWHKANEEPIKGRIILVMTSVCNIADKNISFMGEYIGNGYIQAFNAKEYINSWANWAYRDELIKL